MASKERSRKKPRGLAGKADPGQDKPESAEAVPTDKGESGEQQVTIARATFSGPLPPPAIMEHYEDIAPGLADRIMTLAESEQVHRQDVERTEARIEEHATRRAQYAGPVVQIATIAGAVAIALFGNPWLGTAAIIAQLATPIIQAQLRAKYSPNQASSKDEEADD